MKNGIFENKKRNFTYPLWQCSIFRVDLQIVYTDAS